MNSRKRLALVATVLVLTCLMLASDSTAAGWGTDVVGMPTPPLKVDLKLSSLPGAGKSTQLMATVSAFQDAPGTTVEINLPDGVKLVSGDLTWQGDLKAGESASFSAGILFTATGEFEITASARSPIDAHNTRLGEGAVAVNVGAESSRLALATQDFSRPQRQVLVVVDGVEPVEKPDASGAGVTEHKSPSACGSVRAYGWAYFRNASDTGWIPAQNVRVELWDSDSWSGDDYLGSDIADSNGYWSVGPVSQDDEWWTCGLDLYNIFVYDASWSRVENGSGDRYAWYSGTASNVGDGTYNFGGGGIPYSLEEYRARNIYQTARRAWVALLTRAFVPAAKATIQYRHSHNSDQTWPHFSRNSQKIYLPGVGQDWSLYSKQKTILHELGHHYQWELYGDWLPTTYCPSPHYVDGASHDNCAWTEGFATYVALFVNEPDGDRTAYGYNYENLPSCASFACGSNVEGRVTASLWDMSDSNNEGPQDVYTSGLSGGRHKIWDIVDTGGHHDNFWQFWVAYRNRFGKFSVDHDACRGVRAIRQNNGDGSLGGFIWFDEWVDMGDIPTQTMVRNTIKYIDLWAYADDYECRDGDLTYVIDYVSNPSVGASVTAGGFVKLQPAFNWTGWSQIRVWAGDGLMWDYDYFWVNVTASVADAVEEAPPVGLVVPLQETPPGTPAPLVTPTPGTTTPEPTYTPPPPPETREPTATPIGVPTDTPTPEPTPTLEVPPSLTPGVDPTRLPTATPTETPTAVPTSFPPTPTPTPPRLSIDPDVVSLKQHQAFTFTVRYGAPPYSWYGTGGAVTPSGADQASYTAGADRGNFVVAVRDNTGTEAVANVLIGGLEITTKPEGRPTHINVGDTLEFKVDDLSSATRAPFLWILDGKGPETAVGIIQAQAGGEEAIFTARGNGTALVTAYGTDPDGNVVNSNAILVIVGNTLEIPDVKGVVGQQATVRINLNNIANRPVGSLAMTILYPTSQLRFKSAEPTFRSSNFTVGFNQPTAGEVIIILTSLTGETIQPGRGPILDLLFDVLASDAQPGSTTANLDFKPDSVTMLDNQEPPQEITVQPKGGTFSVVEASALVHDGDVDQNGRVNVRDLALAIQIFLNRYAPSTEEFAAADISPLTTGDGNVNVTDVLKIFNKALGKPISLFRLLAGTGPITLRVPDRASARAGEELLVPVTLNHPADAVGGLDFTLVYTATTGVYTPTLTLAQRAVPMRSSLNTDITGRTKVILYSPDTVQNIAAGEGNLLTLSFGTVAQDVSLKVSVASSTVSDLRGDAMAHTVSLYDPRAPSDDPRRANLYVPLILKNH